MPAATATPTKTRDEIKTALQAEQWIYLVATDRQHWGKGFTLDQAKTAAQVKRGDAYIAIAAADPWARIDDMGGITYTPRSYTCTAHNREDCGACTELRTTEYLTVEEHRPTRRR